MTCYVVIFHATLVGVYSCGVDAHCVHKRLLGSTVQQVHMNSESEEGGKVLRPLG